MISIIIVNYNLADEITNCINSLLQIKSRTEFEILVVDNNSTEESSKKLHERFSSVDSSKLKFLRNTINYGFGSGNNLGVENSNGELILFLNPDTFIETNIFDTIQDFFNENSDIAVLGPVIKRKNGDPETSFGRYPGLVSEIFELFQLKELVNNRFYKSSISKAQKVIDVDWVTGSALFIRRKIFEKVCCFDTNFFMYSEEVDLCKRIKGEADRVVFFKDVEVVHLGSIASKKNYTFFTKTSYESKIYYIKKHFNGIIKIIMLKLLMINLSVQLVLWTIMFPFFPNKSKGKLTALPLLLLKVFSYKGQNANLH